jgi:L-arabinose transport system permease protein
MTIGDHGHSGAGAPAVSVADRIGVRNIGLLVALLLLVAIIGATTGGIFFTSNNLINIGLAVATLGLLAMSQTVLMVAGEIDLSIGAVAALVAVAAATAAQSIGSGAAGVLICVLIGLLVGAACGAINGIIVTRGNVGALIATIGTLATFRGLAFVLSDGQAIVLVDDTWHSIGSGRVLGLPFPIWVLFVSAVLFHVFLSRSIAGRNVLAIGGNSLVAQLSGIDVDRYRVAIYAMSGLVAGVAGIILAARTGSATANFGTGVEFQVIAAAVLGGTTLRGGSGSIVGALLAALVITVLKNGMILTGVSVFFQTFADGLLLLLAVLVAEYRRNHVPRGKPVTNPGGL